MKKTIALCMLVALSVISYSFKFVSGFEGSVTYSISFEGSGLPPEALAMFKGSEAISYIKGEKRRMDMNMPMQSTISISDAKTKTVSTYMDIMGMKYLIKMNENDIKKEEEKAPEMKIKYTDETKEVAGYKCKKAEVTLKTKDGKEETLNVYYTEEIPTTDVKSVYKGLKGFPLEYVIDQKGMKMKFTATKVNKETVPDSKFEISKEGYTETTMEELQNAMMKMGGK
ncbi:MAG: GLPGLI family protein [Bacteroidia bacterium]|nr:GLPGLI family protein [Bacteroidia bacterium]